MLRRALVIVLIALIVSACSSSRQTVSESTELRSSELRSSDMKDSVVVEVHDTIMETTTIVIRENEAGDTLRLSRVTERDRIRDRTQERRKEVEVRVVRDTIFIEKRDSVSTTTNLSNPTNKASPVMSGLKWIFAIIVSLIVLVFILKYRRF